MDIKTMIPVICIALALAVAWDLKTQRIPNVLTAPLGVGGLVFHLTTTGLPGLKSSALGLAMGLGIFIVPFLLGGMGGGDVKLLAGLGAWLGPKSILIAALYTGVAGGLLALGTIVASGGKKFNFTQTIYEDLVCFMTLRGGEPVAARSGPGIPYSLAIAAGTLGFVLLGPPV